MHRVGLWLVLTLAAVTWGATALSAAPILMLLPSGDLAGPAGATLGWGFTISNDTNYIEITSAQFCANPVDFPLSCNAPASGNFTDFISQFNDIIVGPPDGVVTASVTQHFDPAAHTGIGSFQINTSASAGSTDVGQIVLTYNEYNADPNIGPFNVIASDQVLPANASVTVTRGLVVPEPATTGLVGIALAALTAIRKRRPGRSFPSRS